jgi:hypothetical protein
VRVLCRGSPPGLPRNEKRRTILKVKSYTGIFWLLCFLRSPTAGQQPIFEESKLTPEQRYYLSTSDELIEELGGADTVVIGAPMHKLCEHVLLRLVNTGQRLFLDLHGMTYLALDTSQLQEANG